MVERTHHSLKARCMDENWKLQLPWVLLSLCTALKANGEASPTEKVTKHFKPKGLNSCKHVFMRNNAHRNPPLTPTRPYRGPYHVICRSDKAYLIMINGCEDWVSIDRLKPAFLMDTREETGSCPQSDSTKQGHSQSPPARPNAKTPKDSAVNNAPQLISRTRG
ncbi:uncharacterized protein LOC135201235 [Macrobrachium nipponense]|uniref:uncharacterized protein LOC135201235 n=1 Tax=Macrobrachium nipponense TaxID=159736 RepID=UPI0030C7BD98